MSGVVCSTLLATPLERSDQFLVMHASNDEFWTQLCCTRYIANVIQGHRYLGGNLVSVPFSFFLLAEFLL